MNKTLLALAAALVVLPAQAVVVTDISGITVVDTVTFDSYDGFITTGPEAVSANVTFSGSSGSQLGAFVAELGTNGLWGAGKVFAATDVTGSLTFALGSGFSTSGIGAFVNHFDGAPTILVEALDGAGNVLEFTNVSVPTPMGFNDGQFIGFSRGTSDINAIRFSGTGVVLDDLVHAAPIPEPGTWAMMLAGVAALGAVARRRRARQA
jgi:hypothetical protein